MPTQPTPEQFQKLLQNPGNAEQEKMNNFRHSIMLHPTS